MDQSIRCLVHKWTPTLAETRFTLDRALNRLLSVHFRLRKLLRELMMKYQNVPLLIKCSTEQIDFGIVNLVKLFLILKC